MKTVFSTIVGLALLGVVASASAAQPSSLAGTQLQCLKLEAAEVPACLLDSWQDWFDRYFGS